MIRKLLLVHFLFYASLSAPLVYGAIDLVFEDGFEPCESQIQGYPDADLDGYGDESAVPVEFCAVLPEGFVDNATDCDDGNADANPAAIGWFSTARANGSYDYNCDGVETRRYTDTSTGCTFSGSSCSMGPPGWTENVPACGQLGEYLAGCDFNENVLLECASCVLDCVGGFTPTCLACIAANCPGAQMCTLDYADGFIQECH